MISLPTQKRPGKFRVNHPLLLQIVLIGLILFLATSRPLPALADGGGPEATATATATVTPTSSVPPSPQPTSAYPRPEDNSAANNTQPQTLNATAAPAANDGGGFSLWPLGLLVLAAIALVVVFLLFRKK
jgi:hypothetical protein